MAGLDSSTGFLRTAVAGNPGVAFAAADARSLPLADGSADAVVSGLALNFVPGPEGAAAEFARVAAPGGVVAAYVWDYAEGMELMRHFWDAAADLDPAAVELDEGRRFTLCRPEGLQALWPAPGWAASTSGRSTSPPCSRTSTTSGSRSSAAGARRRPTSRPCRRTAATPCATCCGAPARRAGRQCPAPRAGLGGAGCQVGIR